MPDLTPQEAQARLAALDADKSGPLYSLNAAESEAAALERWDLTRIAMGADGEKVLYENTFMTTPSPEPTLPPAEQAVFHSMTVDELAARAPALQDRFHVPVSESRLRAFAAALTPRPGTMPLRIEDALARHPHESPAALQYLFGLGWQSLKDSGVFPFSAVVAGENGARYAEGFFEYVKDVGARVHADREAARLRRK